MLALSVLQSWLLVVELTVGHDCKGIIHMGADRQCRAVLCCSHCYWLHASIVLQAVRSVQQERSDAHAGVFFFFAIVTETRKFDRCGYGQFPRTGDEAVM